MLRAGHSLRCRPDRRFRPCRKASPRLMSERRHPERPGLAGKRRISTLHCCNPLASWLCFASLGSVQIFCSVSLCPCGYSSFSEQKAKLILDMANKRRIHSPLSVEAGSGHHHHHTSSGTGDSPSPCPPPVVPHSLLIPYRPGQPGQRALPACRERSRRHCPSRRYLPSRPLKKKRRRGA